MKFGVVHCYMYSFLRYVCQAMKKLHIVSVLTDLQELPITLNPVQWALNSSWRRDIQSRKDQHLERDHQSESKRDHRSRTDSCICTCACMLCSFIMTNEYSGHQKAKSSLRIH